MPLWAIWANLDHFGPLSAILATLCNLGHFGTLWATLGILGHLGHFGPFGPVWANWATLDHLGKVAQSGQEWPSGPKLPKCQCQNNRSGHYWLKTQEGTVVPKNIHPSKTSAIFTRATWATLGHVGHTLPLWVIWATMAHLGHTGPLLAIWAIWSKLWATLRHSAYSGPFGQL